MPLRHVTRAYVRTVPFQGGKDGLIALVERHSRRREAVITRVCHGLTMELDLGSSVERQIYYWGFYRRWLLPHYVRLLKSTRTVIDVGANVGQYALVAARELGPSARIVAFEPEATCYRKLLRNILLNGFETITPENYAVAGVDGEATLNCNPEADVNQAQSSLVALPHHQRTQSVKCVALDTYCSSRELRDVGVLKIDAQGAEMQALEGCARTIRRDVPHVLLRCHDVFVRAMGSTPMTIQEFLLDQGYALFDVPRWGNPTRITRPRSVSESVFLARHPRRESAMR
jgi:FkbM family methyltransferase